MTTPEPPPLASSAESRPQHRAAFKPESAAPGALAGVFSQVPRLDRLALPDEYLRLIEPVLTKLGATQREERLETIEGGERATFHFTLVIKVAKRALLCLTDEVLTVFSRGTKLALTEVRELFAREYDVLYLFHEGPPHVVYKNLMQYEWWRNYGIRVEFIALTDLRNFQQVSLEEQAAYLNRVLNLDAVADAPAPAGQRRPAKDMQGAEKRTLVKIIGAMPSFDDVRKRRVLLQGAELDALARDLHINLEGDQATVAGELILNLPTEGLGKLLPVLAEEPGLSITDKKFIQKLLEQYTFD